MTSRTPFGEGLGVALATPFMSDSGSGDGGIDTSALVRLVRHCTAGGADFVVALGSTGEAAMLTESERDHVVATAREHAGRAAVFVGTGASSTAQTIAWTRRARELGAHGALVVVPPYTRPTQAGLLAHFEAVAAAVPDLPLVVYNVPARTATNLLPATMQRLWSLPTVIALKESSGDLQQIGRIGAELPPGKTLLAGDDALLLPTIAVGGTGVISVAGNAVPGAMRELLAAARSGSPERARSLQARLLPLFEALSAEPNPIPVKQALALLGIAGPTMRLPLLEATAATRERLQGALSKLPAEVSHA
ncbi:MAG TPA: 4-hydroxy-tetrahydrodipicolinate synthase [Planctomycetota bacterium]